MLNPKALALSGGIIWGLGLFILTFLGMYVPGYGLSFFQFITDVYPGYGLDISGAFLGLAYGFLDAFIGLYIFAWLYNKFSNCCCKDSCKKK
ncbi:bacteriophage holin [Candidatus Peregrinibacteria bacterium]|jgi:hypothetical protein|nr:bacteriophage holin [Candidatus Peregrinibacteria bacterium]